MLPTINLVNIQSKHKLEKTQKQGFELRFNIIFIFDKQNKMIPRSIRTFWYKGSAENKETWQVKKKSVSLKNSCLKLKG